MVSLVDIIDIKRIVKIRGNDLEVEGINAEKLAQLIVAFPDLRLAFAGKAEDMSEHTIIAMGPAIVASVIAAGIGKPGDDAEEAAAAKLTIGEQLSLLAAIVEVTFPDGVGPFVEKLRSMGLMEIGGEAGAFGKAPVTNSHAPPSPSPAMAAPEALPPS